MQLFKSERFTGANVSDLDGLRKVVNLLVKTDRLPERNPLEGLELLFQPRKPGPDGPI